MQFDMSLRQNPSSMLKNNIKIAFRALLRQKAYAVINISGLAVGIASCLLITLFVRNEFSYDRFLKDGDRIYKFVLERKYPDHSTYYSTVPHSFMQTANRDYPEIEKATYLIGPFPNTVISYTDEKDVKKEFEENFIFAADSSFFSVFSFTIVKGDTDNPLAEPNDLIVTEKTADRYFGETDPIGKVITTQFGEFKVTAVTEDAPENSHLKFDMLIAAHTFPFVKVTNYTGFSAHTYFKLLPDTDPRTLERKFPQMVDTYAAAEIERNLAKSWEDYKKEGNGYRYFLQPVTGIHLDPTNFEGKILAGGNITSVYIMISVAVLILFIACINFMNLATARSAERAKEVGVRKTMGSFKGQLVFQFLTESFLLSLLGVLLAVAIVQISLPFFNNLTGKGLHFGFEFFNVAVLTALAAVVGLLAGVYPSFVLSSFNPVVVMKGNFTGHSQGKWIRSGLVIFQFWISIVLMIGTMVMQDQMKYIREKSLGFDRDQILVVERLFAVDTQLARTFIEEVRRMEPVIDAAGSFALPGRLQDFIGIQFQPEGSSEILTTKAMAIDDRLAKVLGIELVDGRWFSDETHDSLSIMLNEAAVKVMGLENPIGRKLNNIQQTPQGNVSRDFTIVGIVKDFNFQSLRDQITPLVIQSNETFNGGAGYALAKVKGGSIREAVAQVESKWKELIPGQSFKFTFLDEDINANYASDQRTGKLFAVFSGLAIFVACIGLFALSAYTANLRTKEIGIRKVLGASVAGILILLSKDFSRMVLIAFFIAIPMAWYVMETWWLQNFAYRIQISIWTMLIAGVAAFMIAWFTVSFQSIKAALRNPVTSLRSE